MSDVTEAPTQDAIAESLLPESEQAIEQPEAEQEPVSEQEAQPVEQAEEVPETPDDWLPGEQDKTFTDDTLSRYAQRYGLDVDSLSNPQIRQLVVDKINSDIFIRQQQAFAQPEAEPEPQSEPTQQQPQVSREQWFQNLDRVVAERTDPEVAKAFHADFLRAFGVPDTEIAKMPASQAMQFTSTASKYMLNLVNTFIGDILEANLPKQLDTRYPGFQDMYERSDLAMSWDRVRNSNSQFASLPAYGTKEFTETLHKAAQGIPGFDELLPEKMSGKEAQRFYSILAHFATNQPMDPQLLQQAQATGARRARQADVRRSAGNLGSGKSNSAGGGRSQQSSRFQSNQDIFDDETMQMLNTRL